MPLENLIGNASKNSAEAHQPRIGTGRTLIGGATAFFARDNGARFDMDSAGQLFTLFQRLRAAHGFEGHGIGLATLQRIIARRGGRVWAEAKVDHAAAFWFTLAMTAGNEGRPSTPPFPAHASGIGTGDVALPDYSAHAPQEPGGMAMTIMRFEGLTLTVEDVGRSVSFYAGKLGLQLEVDAAPAFALIRIAGGGTIGLLSLAEAAKEGAIAMSAGQKMGIHVEFSTADLDGLFEILKAKGVSFHQPPHDEPWERSMTALDPDGYAVEFSQGRRGKNKTGT